MSGTWRGDFRRLWTGYAVSQVGSAVGTGELAIVAALVLEAPAWQVSTLASASGLTAAAIALPLGPFVEFHRKRSVMIAADLIRFAALGSVPLFFWFGWLTFAQLCVVGVIQVCGSMVFNAASVAHLKTVVPDRDRARVNGDIEATSWFATTSGPPIGGALISLWGATTIVALDAISFVASAVCVRSLRTQEPAPPVRAADRRWASEIRSGWSYIFGHSVLRSLFVNALLFGSGIMWISPLLTVFMLRDLHLAPWQYGLSLGIEGAGGLAGALWSKRASRSRTSMRLLLVAGTARCLPVGFLAVAPQGSPGLILITTAETLLLFFAGAFNPAFGTYRMNATADDQLARVTTAWSISSKTAQPAMVLLGGLIAAVTNIRISLALAAALVLLSAVFLPWSHRITASREESLETAA